MLADYPTDAPSPAEGPAEAWACPLPSPALEAPTTPGEKLRQQLTSEVRFLRPWYEEGLANNGRSVVGLSGLTGDAAEAMASTLASVALGEQPEAPEGSKQEFPLLIRYLADDLKTFYFEAAAAQPRSRRPTSKELNTWLFGETVFGTVLYDAKEALEKEKDRAVRQLGFFLVPQIYGRRPKAD